MSGARTCLVKGMLTALWPVPFPAVPASVQGAWARLTPIPAAWGKLLRKVKVVLAKPPEISSVWTRGWEGPENNVGARMLWDTQGFQACCSSSSPLPGTAAAGVTLSPGPQGWLPQLPRKSGPLIIPRNHASPSASRQPFGSCRPPLGTPSWCKEGRKNRIRVKVLTSPPTSCMALSKSPCHSEAQLSHE